MNPPRRAVLPVYLLASLCSGCAALLSQVMWSRMLSLVFGSDVEAVAAVTATFMAGLALGSALGPRLARDREGEAVARLYAAVEAAMAAAAVILAFVLPALESARATLGPGATWALAILLLLAPSTLMGTTLVLQTQALTAAADAGRGARAAGLLFAANTFGAVAGSYGGVLWTVPQYGVKGTLVVAAVLNGVAALLGRFGLAAAVAAPGPARPARRASGEAATEPPPSAAAPDTPLVLAALFAAGFAGLANEVAWTRAFILVAGPTVHAFAFVLGAIVAGLAIGSAIASALLPRDATARLALSATQAGVALACAGVIAGLAGMPIGYGEDVRRLVDRPDALIRLQAERSFLLLVLPAVLSGALFPLGLRILRAGGSMTRAMGLASAANTCGAIAGALLAGFILLPGIGLDRTLRFAATVSALSALAVGLRVAGPRRLLGAGLALAALVAVHRTPSFDQELFAGGAYKYSAYDPGLSLEEVLRRGELMSYAEGRVASVSVKRVGSSFSLAVDGKVDATSGGDMLTQRLLAHVPFLVSENPRRALVIGLGSGVTAGSALTHGPEGVTAVEISPEVATAARRFFASANGGALDNPKLRLVLGDARQHVISTPDRYDVVISEPSNPWMAGVSALFTREFFARVRARLEPGGVFCQWGHLYNMSPRDLRTLLATFRDVFPDGRVFVISEADILIVGGAGGGALSPRRLAAIAPGARADLAASGLSPEILAAIPTVSFRDLAPELETATRHTDDRPVLDYRAPLSMHAQTSEANRVWLLPRDAPADADVLDRRLRLLAASGSEAWTYDLASDALARGLGDRFVAEALVRSAVKLHRAEAAEAVLDAAVARAPASGLLVARALLLWNTSRPGPALQSLEAASRLDPGDASAYRLAAEIQSTAGDLQAMRKLVARALALDPRDPEALGLAGEAELKDGRFDPARRLAEGALSFDPRESRALEVRALALAQLGRAAEARAAFHALLDALPEMPSPRVNFGVFELQNGDAAAAARLFRDAIDLDPSGAEGYRGLREAADILKDPALRAVADRGLERLSGSPSRD